MALERGTPPWVIVGQCTALVFLFVGERVVPTIAPLRQALSGLGVAGFLALAVVRWIATTRAEGERRSVERALAILSTIGALAILLYLTTAEPLNAQLGITKLASETRNRYEAAATVAWIALLVCSLVPMLFAERALFPMRRAASIEWRRVRDAMTGGLTLGLAVVYGALYCFVAGELDVKADFSYFHTARASESTRKVAASANDKLRIVAFFPQLNEVGSEVSTYLNDVARGLPNIEVRVEDRLLVPQLAKDMKVFDDGVIVVERGTQKETLTVGTDMQVARAKLKTLDADFQKSLLKVLRAKKTAYFTVGHGELNDAQPTPQNEGRTSKGIRELIDHQNYTIRDLSAATGLATEVPDDATLVLVVGPQQALLPEEIGALKRFAARGGSLFLCLDPEPKIDNGPLADIVGLTVGTSILANDKVHMRRRFNDSDRIILATNRFSSHASVSTLSRVASHPVIFLGAAALDPGKDASFKIDLTVRGMPDTFNDDNGDFKWETPQEKKNQYGLVAAVSKTVNGKEARAVVVGDADAVSDAVLGNEGNVLLVADAVRWLSGEESFAGVFSSAEDVRIEHTKQKDLVWFYGTIFGAPAVVLGLGLLYTRRVRRSKKKPAPPPPADAPKPPPSTEEEEEEAA